MKTLTEELKRILEGSDDKAVAEGVREFFLNHGDSLPLPGEDSAFDRAIWAASEYVELSERDEKILERVSLRMLSKTGDLAAAQVVKLRDLVGAGRDAALKIWQEMLASMSWQQMVPAGAMRGVGAKMISLGSFQQDLSAGASIQLNIGWLVDQDELRILLNARDEKGAAMPDVELRVKESERGVVFSRKTNQDGSLVAPGVKVGPGQYQIEILAGEDFAETPYFVL